MTQKSILLSQILIIVLLGEKQGLVLLLLLLLLLLLVLVLVLLVFVFVSVVLLLLVLAVNVIGEFEQSRVVYLIFSLPFPSLPFFPFPG